MSVCDNCGKDLNINGKFCEHCGAPVAKKTPTQANSVSQEQTPVNIENSQDVPMQTSEQGSYQPSAQPTAQQNSDNTSVQRQSGSYQSPFQAEKPQQNYSSSAEQITTPQQGTYQPPFQQMAQPESPQTSAPVQGSYQPQHTYTGSQTAVKQKKAINPKILIFAGIGIAAIVIISIIASLIGGKNKTDSNNPYIGVWNAVTIEMFEEVFPADDVLGSLIFEFEENGKCLVQTDEDSHSYKWKENKQEISIISNGDTIITCIKDGNGLVVEDFMDTGMKIVFEKEGKAIGGLNANRTDININSANSANNVQEKWNGSWYGYLYLSEAFGEWAEYEDDLYDAYMVIDVDKNGEGTMAIFLEDNDQQTVDSYIIADEYHFEVTEGEFWDYTLDPAQWWIGISPIDDGNLIVISDFYADPELTENDGFEYMFCFRPWGELWAKEEKEVNSSKPGSKLPPGYDDYVVAIKNGVADPNFFENDGN